MDILVKHLYVQIKLQGNPAPAPAPARHLANFINLSNPRPTPEPNKSLITISALLQKTRFDNCSTTPGTESKEYYEQTQMDRTRRVIPKGLSRSLTSYHWNWGSRPGSLSWMRSFSYRRATMERWSAALSHRPCACRASNLLWVSRGCREALRQTRPSWCALTQFRLSIASLHMERFFSRPPLFLSYRDSNGLHWYQARQPLSHQI